MIYDFSDGHPEHRYGLKPAIAAQDMHRNNIKGESKNGKNNTYR